MSAGFISCKFVFRDSYYLPGKGNDRVSTVRGSSLWELRLGQPLEPVAHAAWSEAVALAAWSEEPQADISRSERSTSTQCAQNLTLAKFCSVLNL